METTILNASQCKFVTGFNNGSPNKPFTKMYTFIKNDQAMTRYAFKEVYNNLRELLDNLELNYGILLTPDGTFVFTEKKVKFDALVVKLATGVNFGKQVNNIKGDMDLVNSVLGR